MMNEVESFEGFCQYLLEKIAESMRVPETYLSVEPSKQHNQLKMILECQYPFEPMIKLDLIKLSRIRNQFFINFYWNEYLKREDEL